MLRTRSAPEALSLSDLAFRTNTTSTVALSGPCGPRFPSPDRSGRWPEGMAQHVKALAAYSVDVSTTPRAGLFSWRPGRQPRVNYSYVGIDKSDPGSSGGHGEAGECQGWARVSTSICSRRPGSPPGVDEANRELSTSKPHVSWVALRRAKRKMLAVATVLIVSPLRQSAGGCAVRPTREHLTSGTQAPGLLDVVRGSRDARECPPVVLSQALASLDKEVTFSTRSLSGLTVANLTSSSDCTGRRPEAVVT